MPCGSQYSKCHSGYSKDEEEKMRKRKMKSGYRQTHAPAYHSNHAPAYKKRSMAGNGDGEGKKDKKICGESKTLCYVLGGLGAVLVIAGLWYAFSGRKKSSGKK